MKSILYKYFPLKTHKHLERMIKCVNGEIYFSSPLNFNDPFEIQATILPPNLDELHPFLKEAGHPIDAQSISYKNKLNRSINNDFLRSPPTINTKEWLSEIGIFCLTESPKNLLMWSHYGSNHTGVCIGFDINEEPFSSARQLIYTDERPQIPFNSYKSIHPKDADKIFLHKSPEWEYEREWRCVKRTIRKEEKEYYSKILAIEPNKFEDIADILIGQGGPGSYDFSNNALKRIYFGCRIEEQMKNKILEAINKSEIHIKKFQLKLDPRHFHLIEDRIKG